MRHREGSAEAGPGARAPLDRIAEDVSTVIDQNTISRSLDEVKEMVAAKNSVAGRALEQDKERALEELEIELESEEVEPFAQGAQAPCTRLHTNEVVAKNVPLGCGDEVEQDDEGLRDGIGHHVELRSPRIMRLGW